MLYIKNGVILDGKKISVIVDGMRVFGPSEAMILASGWVVYNPAPAPTEPSKEDQYKQRVIDLIRERYSVDDELAILRQRDNKVEEFNEYNAFVESVKVIAHNEIYGDDNVCAV